MIRSVQAADFDELLQIEARAFPKSQYDRRELWILHLQYPNSFLVSVSERIDGYIVFKPEGHIISMAVTPEKRRSGVGTTLVKEAIQYCREKSLRLEVRVGNGGAQKFYHSLGFVIKARIESYYQDGEDAFLMERSAADTEDNH